MITRAARRRAFNGLFVLLCSIATAIALSALVMILWTLLAFTDTALRQAVGTGHISTSILESTQVGEVRFMLVGLGLVLLVVFRPQGIFGDKKEIALDAR